MNRKCLLLLVQVIIISLAANAQNAAQKISGMVSNAQQKALTGATIVLRYEQDSLATQTIATDQNGAFAFTNLRNGIYALTISHVGFSDHHIAHLVVDDTHSVITLPLIVLQSSTHQALKEVTVIARKPLTEQKIDRVIVNVDAMISAASSNALEVLAQSPGVMVDINDDIRLNGKSNVLVLIDDRPTYMSAQDLAAYLRSLPGGLLDKLELISNPPARYDAAGSAIINIVLKKNRTAGFNSALTLGYKQGRYARINNALNSNYRTARFNIFGNISYSYDRNFNDQTYNRYFYNKNGSTHQSIFQKSRYDYQTSGWNSRIGMDYFVSPKTVLGVVLTGGIRPRSDRLDYHSDQYDHNQQLDSVAKGYTGGNYRWRNGGINVNLQHKFDSTGSMLTANLDVLDYKAMSDQQSPADIYLPDGTLYSHQQRLFSIPSNISIYAGKLDYTQPLARKATLDAGIKSSYVTTDIRSGWFNQSGNELLPDYSRSNHFHYTENINSVYVNLKKEWKRWALQGGLRMENTVAKGHQFSNPAIPDSAFTKRYTSLFPSLYLLYKLDSNGHNTLVISYSKRIRRPSYQQLNPFLFFQDQYSYNAGNPGLTAAFSQSIELRYSYKQFIGVTVGYARGNAGINTLTLATGNVFITRPQNYINNRLYSLIPYISWSLTPWWTLNINAVLIYQTNKGSADGVVIDQQTNVHEIETSSQFRFSKGWSAELNGFFPGRQSFGQSRNESVYNISAGIQKNVLHNQGTVRLLVNDIFHSLNMKSQTTGIEQVAAYNSRRTDTRYAGLSFTWRFGKTANARKRNDSSSAEEEKGRTN